MKSFTDSTNYGPFSPVKRKQLSTSTLVIASSPYSTLSPQLKEQRTYCTNAYDKDFISMKTEGTSQPIFVLSHSQPHALTAVKNNNGSHTNPTKKYINKQKLTW